MPSKRSQPFALLDLMILVAGIAISLGFTKYRADSFVWSTPPDGIDDLVQDQIFRNEIPGLFKCFLASMSCFVLILAVRQSRTRRSRLLFQPGILVCVFTFMSYAIFAPLQAIRIMLQDKLHVEFISYSISFHNFMISWWDQTIYVEDAVPPLWGILALTGRWRVRGAADWLGVSIGICYILVIVYTYILLLVDAFLH